MSTIPPVVPKGSYARSKPTSLGGDLPVYGVRSPHERLFLGEELFKSKAPIKATAITTPINPDFIEHALFYSFFHKPEDRRRKTLKSFNKAAKKAVKKFLNK